MERPHGQLRPRFSDRLRGNDTDGFTDIDQRTAPEVTPIAFGAQAIARITGQRCAYLDFVNAEFVDQVTQIFINQRASLNHRLIAFRVDDISNRHATKNALAQGLDDFTALDQGLHRHAVISTAIVLDDDQILCHVDQTARQITRVRCLQGGIGQTLTGAVRRNEVLQNVQSFAEVGGDRRLDNRTVRLRHQAAHPRQLTNLRRGATGPRISHHVDRVERFLLDFLAQVINDLFMTQLLHHHLGHLVAGAAPDINHLVVAFAIGHETIGVLALDFLHFFFSGRDDFVLLGRHQHIIGADRDAGTGRQPVAVLHQLVGKDHRLFEAAATECRIDQFGDLFFLEWLIENAKRQALRQNLGKQRTARRCPIARQLFLPATIATLLIFLDPHRNFGVQFKLTRL